MVKPVEVIRGLLLSVLACERASRLLQALVLQGLLGGLLALACLVARLPRGRCAYTRRGCFTVPWVLFSSRAVAVPGSFVHILAGAEEWYPHL